jgi:hypothetical protein
MRRVALAQLFTYVHILMDSGVNKLFTSTLITAGAKALRLIITLVYHSLAHETERKYQGIGDVAKDSYPYALVRQGCSGGWENAMKE